MKRPLQLPLAIALALGGTNALALGLGPVHVKSKLNQPLDAEIPVIQGTAGEAEGLLVSLAAAEDFERVGISRSRLNVPLDFTLVKGANGQSVIKVTSKEPVRDAYLDFLVEANWPKGRLLREYTVLLDPPVTAPSRRTATTATPAVPRAATSTQPLREAAPKPVAAAPKAARQVAPKPAPSPARKISEGEYGPVEAGETLSAIARAARPDPSVNVNQVMLALLKSNPDAFFKDNVNALKRGAILRIPSAEEIRANASATAAAAEIQSQIEDWRGGRASPTRVADAGSNAIEAPAPVVTTPAKASRANVAKADTDSERLELVPPKAGRDNVAMADQPGSGAGTAAASGALKAELARAKEALTAREQEAGELKSRVDELEELTDKNERLIGLKDSEIAELQRKLRELREQPVASTPVAPEAITASPTPAASAPGATSSAPVAATPPPPAVADTGIDKQDIWGDAGKDNGAPSTSTPAPDVVVDTVTAPSAPASTSTATAPPASVDTPASGATVTPLAPTPPTIASRSSTVANAPAVKPAGTLSKPVAVTPEAPWYDAPWVKPAALGAGVLLLLLGLLGLRKRKAAPAAARGSIAGAFGDSPLSGGGDGVDAVAAEAASLREMLRDDPSNVGLHLELLSIYYAERDVVNFEDAAAEMHAYVSDPHQPEWLEAQAMGQELAPQNPLFAGIAQYDETDAAIASAQDDTDEFPAFEDEYIPNDGISRPTAGSEYTFGDAAIDSDTFAEVARAAPTVPAAKADEPFDFSDLPPLEAAADDIVEPMPETPAPAAGLDDDYFPGEDAIGTKLDLAKAYMDMGDPEGARSMLEEVVAEGSDAQKAEAHRLIADLG